MNIDNELSLNDITNFLDESFIYPQVESFPTPNDIITLSKQIENLSLNVNTQGLKLKLEKMRRQKLGATLKRVKQDSIPLHRMVTQLQRDNDILREQFSASDNIHYRETARLRDFTYFCLSQLHQILVTLIPHVNISFDGHNELSQLICEMLRALRQIRLLNDFETAVSKL